MAPFNASRPSSLRSRLLTAAALLGLAMAAGTVLGLAAQPEAPGTTPAPASPTKPTPAGDLNFSALMASLSADEQTYLRHLVTLSNPWMGGREPGDRGNALAGEYVEWSFRQLGLRPAFPITEKAADGTEVRTPWSSYRQPFPFGSRATPAEQTVRVLDTTGPFGQANPGPLLVPGVDFNVLAASGSGKVDGAVAFVGYSITSGPDGYSSYAEGDDLKGRVAMVLRFEPLDEQGRSRWRPQAAGAGAAAARGFSPASALAPKLKAAADRGAAAIILVNPPGVDDPRGTTLDTIRAGAERGFPVGGASNAGGSDARVPVIQMSTRAADELVRRSGTTLAELRAQADTKTPDQRGVRVLQSSQVALDIRVERREVIAANIAGILPGRGKLASDYLVIGGHYDHVGFGYFGSRARSPQGILHPGADDNASGTAGVLLAAEIMSRKYAQLPPGSEARSIVFIGFDAEESGLNGARHFVRNAPIPAANITAMLNMDMIGRVKDNKLMAAGVGTAEGFADLLAPIFDAAPIAVRTLPGGRGPSDHAEFYRANIPVLHFFSGLHTDYHMPSDTSDKINTPGAVRSVAVVVDTAMLLASRTDELKFTPSRGASVDMTMQPDGPTPPAPAAPVTPSSPSAPSSTPTTPSLPATPPPTGAHGGGDPATPSPGATTGTRVRFGIAPDNYGDEEAGVLVGDVYPDTAAAQAGIAKGDRLMKWDDKPIKDVEAWMPLLQAAKPGQEVRITLIRAGKTIEVPVKLRARD